MPISFKPEMFVEGKWHRNGLVFATREEAEANAKAKMWNWINVKDCRAVQVDERVNATWTGSETVMLPDSVKD